MTIHPTYRRLTEAARAELLAQAWARRTVTVSLIADVAPTYFQLLELDRELETSRRTLASRRESLLLDQARETRGVASYLQVLDAERNLFEGELALAQTQREELLSVVRLYRSLGGGWKL